MDRFEKAFSFHKYWDNELVYVPGRVIQQKETRYLVLQERDVSYQFSLHQHPLALSVVTK